MFDIDKKVNETYEEKKRLYPCRSNRASMIGHPCLRYLVYCRKDWDKKKLPDLPLLFIFEGGEYFERLGVERLTKAGFKITSQQRDFEDKTTGITGHVDGFIASPENPDESFPIEIKGLNQWDWKELNTIDDMIKSEKVWVKGYPAQLQIYLYLAKKERGCFYLINKATLEGKTIWVDLDYDYVESILQKAEAIEKFMQIEGEAGYPERIKYDPDVCNRCDFNHLCTPEKSFPDQIDFSENEEIVTMIKRREELDPLRKEYEELDKDIKEIATVMPKDNWFVGGYVISRKTTKGVRKATEEKEYTMTRVKITKVGGVGTDE